VYLWILPQMKLNSVVFTRLPGIFHNYPWDSNKSNKYTT
jgi:hypothetical protein